MASTVVRNISPMIPVADMDEALAFFSEVLGFTTKLHTPDYSIVERDGRLLHLPKAASVEVLESVRKHMAVYVEVSNIHSLWDHVRTYKDRYRIHDLFDRDYGMTEFHIHSPDGCLIFVGEPTAAV